MATNHDIYSHSPQRISSATRSSSTARNSTLARYKETDEVDNYANDFELENAGDFDLSYSKFSNISGVSVLMGKESSSSESASGSPFVKKIQYKLHDIKAREEKRLNSRGSDHKHLDTAIYPIIEASSCGENDENSPFLSKTRPQIKQLHSSNTDVRRLQIQRSRPTSGDGDSNSTPKQKIHMRNPSVKMSLTPAQRVEKRPGTRAKNALENFQFKEMVGKGAFATVYRGINLKTKQVVAIKQITLEPDQDVQELMGEIDLLKILKHPNIVKYHGFVKTSTSLNVFLEYCAGGSLRQLYKRLNTGLPEIQIASFVKAILMGLNYLHEQGVVHRDVKAANVLMMENGDIKLADFGVATRVSAHHESVVGTPNWMAPETVLGGEGLCTASDIWSLGATIIELFTMNPPYHDLNPMATLHAIGTDDHPPLPKNLSSVGKDFLMECFQKQPSLRTTAKLLLKHRWLLVEHKKPRSAEARENIGNSHHTTNVRSMMSFTEENEENWENDFEDIKANRLSHPGTPGTSKEPPSHEMKLQLSNAEVLSKFSENNNEDIFDTKEFIPTLPKIEVNGTEAIDEEDSDDPFTNIEIDNFNTNDLEIQSKIQLLINKLSNRVDVCQSGDEDVANSLVKVMGKISHLVKKYPVAHDVLIRDHGILCIFEMLESAPEMPNIQKLWYHALATLNCIFEESVAQLESFCLLGGIPVITQFRTSNNDQAVRQQVVRFIKSLSQSDRALSMFISCGGLRVLSKLAEEDFDYDPTFPLTAVDCIHHVLNRDLTRSKSDLCRKLSHYGVIFWFVVLLNRLCKFDASTKFKNHSASEINLAIDRIIEIIKHFGQSEVKVRSNIASVDLFKLLIKVYPRVQLTHQLSVLKFFKAMSCIADILKVLQSAEILEFLVSLLKKHSPGTQHYKEYINIICPVIYNYCYLNHKRETELVRLGALPHLKELSKINLPFRQFVLPVVCELVYCDEYVRQNLVKHQILDVYLNLLMDPYWQANALDSILGWCKQDTATVDMTSAKALSCLQSGFILNKVSNLESALDNYLKLITQNDNICRAFASESFCESILVKLSVNSRNSVVQLTLLRILRALVVMSIKASHNLQSFDKITEVLSHLQSRKSSLLVDELAMDIMAVYTI